MILLVPVLLIAFVMLGGITGEHAIAAIAFVVAVSTTWVAQTAGRAEGWNAAIAYIDGLKAGNQSVDLGRDRAKAAWEDQGPAPFCPDCGLQGTHAGGCNADLPKR